VPQAAAMTLIAVAALVWAGATCAADDSPAAVDVRARVAKAGDEPGPAAGPARSSEVAPPAPGRTPKGPPASLFRCWQGGRIIFEGRGYGALPPAQIAAELKAADGGSGRLQVLDLTRGVCVLELPK
jgi:hypothetical protein